MISSKMKVTKTVSIDVLGLGAKIKEAREADVRSLKTICESVEMSLTNWYRIEEEKQTLPIETLRKIEQVLGVDFELTAGKVEAECYHSTPPIRNRT